MQSTLHGHILHLEHLIQTLIDKLTDPRRTVAERKLLVDAVHTAELSLLYYRKAFELEQQLNLASNRSRAV